LDRYTIEEVGVPGVALMELASRGVAETIAKEFRTQAAAGVLVLCGSGNNGGDGYGCARWLKGWGFPVSTWSTTDRSSGDAGLMREACTRAGVAQRSSLGSPGLIVDALFGTGLSRPVEGRLARLIGEVNQSAVPVVSVDIPSGICADTGAVLGVAIKAQATVSFGARKQGFYGEPGADHLGSLSIVDIGLGVAPASFKAYWLEESDFIGVWPSRAAGDHKGRSGHLLVVAGSAQMSGAAALCCRAALAAGAGLVTLVSARGAYPRLEQLGPEVMVAFGGDGDRVESIPDGLLEQATAVVCGPGLGGGQALGPELRAALRALWSDSALPVLYDADALSCAGGVGAGPRLITPHPGEAGRILGLSAAQIQADRFAAARRLAAAGTIALLKGRNTLTSDGEGVFVNSSGSPVLATAGSGDVLSGVIGALLSRGVEPLRAAQVGAYVHGAAGDYLADARGQGWTASDIAAALPQVVEGLAR
jgi:NAD(P)H-hydrate epimerase